MKSVPLIGRAAWDCDACGRKNTGQSGPSKVVIPMAGMSDGRGQSQPCIMRFCVDCAPLTQVQLAMVCIPKEVPRPPGNTEQVGDLDPEQYASADTLTRAEKRGPRKPCNCERPVLGGFSQEMQAWPCTKCGGFKVLDSQELPGGQS